MTAVEAALARVQTQLGPADYDLFRRLVNTLTAVTAILHSHRAMLARLRRLFGLSTSEKSRDVLKGQDAATEACRPGADAAAAPADSGDNEAATAAAEESSGQSAATP